MPPSLQARARYGLRVVGRGVGVLRARMTAAAASQTAARHLTFNAMFGRDLVAALDVERRRLQQFDLYLFDVMNAPRLRGQIVFEYGLLLRAVADWSGLTVLDVGTGRSTLPRWMSRSGARVTTFDLSAPAETATAGFERKVDRLVAFQPGTIRAVAGSMRQLPFGARRFQLVTCLSVLEHLDTEFPSRAYVPYDAQRARLAEVLDEMIRVAAPGAYLYITSECCDYGRATTDAWRGAYYYRDGPPLSAAWPVHDVSRLFYDYLTERGCAPVGPITFDPRAIDDPAHWTSRGPYFSGFSVLVRTP